MAADSDLHLSHYKWHDSYQYLGLWLQVLLSLCYLLGWESRLRIGFFFGGCFYKKISH